MQFISVHTETSGLRGGVRSSTDLGQLFIILQGFDVRFKIPGVLHLRVSRIWTESVRDRKCGGWAGREEEEEFLSNDESIIHIQAINLDARPVPPSQGSGTVWVSANENPALLSSTNQRGETGNRFGDRDTSHRNLYRTKSREIFLGWFLAPTHRLNPANEDSTLESRLTTLYNNTVTVCC